MSDPERPCSRGRSPQRPPRARPPLETTTAIVVLVLLVLRWAVETALGWLNLAHARAMTALPPALAGQVSAETAARSRAYTLARQRLALWRGAAGTALVVALLYSGALPALWEAVGRWGATGLHRGVLFLALLAVALGAFNLPFRLYAVFGIETRFGFNRTTLGLWLRDRVKGLVLAAVLGLGFLYALLAFMEGAGRWWWLWAFGFVAAYQLALTWLYPTLIAPWFNRFTPLAEGPLKARLEALARWVGYRPRGVYVMDASRRSGHANAYLVGFLRPRIVLFDTLLAAMSEAEVEAVLAHELGHYREHHVRKGMFISLAMLLATLWVLSLLLAWPPLFAAFGFAAPAAPAALALFALAGGAFAFPLQPLAAWYSRRNEYAADAFSVRAVGDGSALKSALVRLNGENLANLWPHPWYGRFHHSHPTLLERLAAIDRLAAAPAGSA